MSCETAWYDARFCSPLPGVVCDVMDFEGWRTQACIPLPAKSDQFYTNGGIIIPVNVFVWRVAGEVWC